jgi:hypothetical protein
VLVPPGAARRDHPPRRRRPPLLMAAAVLTGALAAGGVALIVGGSRGSTPVAAPLPAHGFSVPSGALPPLPGSGAPGAKAAGHGGCDLTVGPSRLLVPGLCINAPVVPAALLPGGSLIIPANVHQVGLWDGGPGLAAGTTGGTTLLAGHVDYDGQGDGALYRLSDVTPGQVIDTVDANGKASRWRALSLRVVVKAALPASLFAGHAGPRLLTLVTCGGPVEYLPGYGSTYADNIIVTAIPYG